MKCPSCGKNAGTVFKCNNCGEARCSYGTCGGSTKANGGAAANQQCKACKKGKYVKIS